MEHKELKKLPSSVQMIKDQGRIILSLIYEDLEFFFKKPNNIEIAYYKDQIYKSDIGISMVQDKFIRQMYIGDNSVVFDNFIKQKPFSINIIINHLFEGLGGDINFTIEEM